jgi:predicted RNA methylase
VNLTLPGLDLAERVVDVDGGQWFTPMPIARRMAAWAGSIMPTSILEPACGSGNLIAACRERWSGTVIEAVELDPYYADRTRDRFADDYSVSVYTGSFLDSQPVGDSHDLCVMNPPYEDGLDGRFLARAMDLSDRVIALVRLAALVGQARTEAVWSRCQPGGDFALRGLALFAGRPRFEAGRAIGDREDGGSAKADFCVTKLSRRTADERGLDIPTHVEWWT